MVNKVHGNINTCATLSTIKVMVGNTLVPLNVNAMRNQQMAQTMINQNTEDSQQQPQSIPSSNSAFVRRNRIGN